MARRMYLRIIRDGRRKVQPSVPVGACGSARVEWIPKAQFVKLIQAVRKSQQNPQWKPPDLLQLVQG